MGREDPWVLRGVLDFGGRRRLWGRFASGVFPPKKQIRHWRSCRQILRAHLRTPATTGAVMVETKSYGGKENGVSEINQQKQTREIIGHKLKNAKLSYLPFSISSAWCRIDGSAVRLFYLSPSGICCCRRNVLHRQNCWISNLFPFQLWEIRNSNSCIR